MFPCISEGPEQSFPLSFLALSEKLVRAGTGCCEQHLKLAVGKRAGAELLQR